VPVGNVNADEEGSNWSDGRIFPRDQASWTYYQQPQLVTLLGDFLMDSLEQVELALLDVEGFAECKNLPGLISQVKAARKTARKEMIAKSNRDQRSESIVSIIKPVWGFKRLLTMITQSVCVFWPDLARQFAFFVVGQWRCPCMCLPGHRLNLWMVSVLVGLLRKVSFAMRFFQWL